MSCRRDRQAVYQSADPVQGVPPIEHYRSVRTTAVKANRWS